MIALGGCVADEASSRIQRFLNQHAVLVPGCESRFDFADLIFPERSYGSVYSMPPDSEGTTTMATSTEIAYAVAKLSKRRQLLRHRVNRVSLIGEVPVLAHGRRSRQPTPP
jgi:hypothetical protein